ncbi:MAG: electron transport complex subunit RsxC [Bacteroidota bacterium]|jgi:electron transport complex protein RnfC|nr:electron transport complex subunit RsxC [Bacteroidota bacterium]
MKFRTFPGGVHPAEEKELSEHCAFEIMPAPSMVVLPLSQHLGKQARPTVEKRAFVARGQVVAEADGFISSPVHAPIAGMVKSIGRESHSSGYAKEALVIVPAELKEGESLPEPQRMAAINPETASVEQIRTRVRDAGIVGQGGAAFPTYVKLTPPEGKRIDTVILNGCECEPYLTRDDRFMLERPDAIVSGLRLIMRALDVATGVIGIENNKPQAIAAMEKAVAGKPGVSVCPLKTKYPQGAEKMLIKAVRGREVPPGKLPLDVGVVIQNIGTAVAIHDAIASGEPSITAALTVTGRGIRTPKNLLVPVGTPLSDVIAFCGGLTEDAAKVIVGGPMMGVAQHNLQAPVMKATSGIVVLTRDEVAAHEETACLRCGRCVDVCPLHLNPSRLARLAQRGMIEEAEQLNITVCMECGSCAFTCPAHIPLVQWLRLGKQRVIHLQRNRK